MRACDNRCDPNVQECPVPEFELDAKICPHRPCPGKARLHLFQINPINNGLCSLKHQGAPIDSVKCLVMTNKVKSIFIAVEIDGGLSEWSPFSNCSIACGKGQAVRARSCTDPCPANGGEECSQDEPELDVKFCFIACGELFFRES